MIIFDLDGTLADCEHRRHFVDPEKLKDWKPDYKSFFEACDKDAPINPTINILKSFLDSSCTEGCTSDIFDIQIWSGRSEWVREKTKKWIRDHITPHWQVPILKMRPIGNTEPDEVLKERWLEESISKGKTIQFVFDNRPKVIRMWRSRGIFVFNCCQHDGEF